MPQMQSGKKSSGGQANAGHPSCLRQVIAERGTPDGFIRVWLVAKSHRLGSTAVADPGVANDVRELRAHLEAALAGAVVEPVPEAGGTLNQIAGIASAIDERARKKATCARQGFGGATVVSKEGRAVPLRLA